MKTIFVPRLLLILGSVVLFLASCTKEPAPYGSGNPFPSVTEQTATIRDMGLVDGVHRLMIATLTNQNITVNSSGNNADQSLDGIASEIIFQIYTLEDGSLPTGAYTFSNDPELQPFTFSSAALNSAYVYSNYVALESSVSDGVLSITQDNGLYHFAYQCILASGESVSGGYSGTALYEDVQVK